MFKRVIVRHKAQDEENQKSVAGGLNDNLYRAINTLIGEKTVMMMAKFRSNVDPGLANLKDG